MNRIIAGLFAAVLVLPQLAWAFDEGNEYVTISPAPAVGSGDEVEVLEFFWYGCPHCYHLEPYMKDWLAGNPAGVNFRRVPVMFGGPANLHAKAFFALEILGESERLHDKLFHAIHEEKLDLKTEDKLEAFLAEQGVDMDKYRAAMSSFTVQTKTNRVLALMKRFGIKGVPAIVVDGRYRNGSLKGYEEFIELTNFLVQKVRDERAQASR